jgi:hypothetical protein
MPLRVWEGKKSLYQQLALWEVQRVWLHQEEEGVNGIRFLPVLVYLRSRSTRGRIWAVNEETVRNIRTQIEHVELDIVRHEATLTGLSPWQWIKRMDAKAMIANKRRELIYLESRLNFWIERTES